MTKAFGYALAAVLLCVSVLSAPSALAGDAVDTYLMDATRGKKFAQIKLADSYYHGKRGVKKDYTQAHRWYLKAAQQGHMDSQFRVAEMYRKGQGIDTDDAAARNWYMKAAEQGHKDASFALGVMYENGTGVDKDAQAAHDWYVKAANAGHATAQYNLGIMYRDGIGVVPDPVAAHMWMGLAAGQGVPRARELRADIASKMTPEQLEDARNRARAWAGQ